MLKPGSSPVDWCESNYIHSPFIAEFVNTVSGKNEMLVWFVKSNEYFKYGFEFYSLSLQFSNILFLTLPPVLIWLFRPYGNSFNKGVHIIWAMLIVVGLCSSYFHASKCFLYSHAKNLRFLQRKLIIDGFSYFSFESTWPNIG